MNTQIKHTKNFGFTLVEMMVVLAIMGILTAMAVASFSAAGRSGRDAKRKADIESIKQALVLRRSDVGSYPVGSTASVLPTPLSDYISNPFPADPFVGRPYTYVSDGSKFCVCGYLENGGGNSTTAAASSTCSFGASGSYYCAANP